MQNLPRISKQLQPMQRIPTKKPTVQKPCIDRADLEFSGLHNKKERKTLRFDVQNSGAPPGTRTLGPPIKRSQRAIIANFQNCVNSLFLLFYRKFVFCICCILCACCPLSHPLSGRSGVQKVCRATISPLKQASDFYAKPGKWPGSNPKRQLQSCLFSPNIKCTSTTTIPGRDLGNCDLL